MDADKVSSLSRHSSSKSSRSEGEQRRRTLLAMAEDKADEMDTSAEPGYQTGKQTASSPGAEGTVSPMNESTTSSAPGAGDEAGQRDGASQTAAASEHQGAETAVGASPATEHFSPSAKEAEGDDSGKAEMEAVSGCDDEAVISSSSAGAHEPAILTLSDSPLDDGTVLDAVVVGAGLSGLTAAYELKRAGVTNVKILEANDRIGGRSNSAELKTGVGSKRFDLGGQWVTRAQPNVVALAEELGIRTHKQYTTGWKVLAHDDGTNKKYSGSIPPVKATGLVKLQLLLNKIDKMTEQVPADNPAQCKHAEEWDATSVEGFMRQHKYHSKVLMQLLDTSNRTIFGSDSRMMSLLGFLHASRTAGGYLRLAETTANSAQEMVLTDCSHGVCRRLAEEVGHDRIALGDPVVSIDQSQQHLVKVTTRSGQEYRCRRVAVTIPPAFYERIAFSPPLSAPFACHARYHPIGHLVKWVATYSTPFWREAGYSGEIVALSNPDPACGEEEEEEAEESKPAEDDLDGRVQCLPRRRRTARFDGKKKDKARPSKNETSLSVVFDNCKEDEQGLHASLVGLAGGTQATYQSQMKMEDLKKQILSDLAKCLGEKAIEPLDFVIKDWFKEKYAGGCPASVYGPGGLTNFSNFPLKPVGRVHWAGTETSVQWKGYLEGAVVTGRRAASELAAIFEKLK